MIKDIKTKNEASTCQTKSDIAVQSPFENIKDDNSSSHEWDCSQEKKPKNQFFMKKTFTMKLAGSFYLFNNHNGEATGNRTQIEGSTNLSVNRYTIASINFKLFSYSKFSLILLAFKQKVVYFKNVMIKITVEKRAENKHHVHQCFNLKSWMEVR